MASSCSMVATTVISGFLSIVPSLALDGADELAGMVFGTADIDDGSVGRGRGVLDHPTQAAFDPTVAASCAQRNPFGQNVWRRGDQDHQHVGIGAAHCANDSTRYVGDDRTPRADVAIDCSP